MRNEIVYMLGVIVVGFAVNYALRALPFLLFAGRDRTLPGWVERLGGILSPVIIGALVVYSFSGLGWRTPAPYLAGALTVALQLWKRNPLASIVAGTVLYMALLTAGCTTERSVALDARDPSFVVTADGCLVCDGRTLTPSEAVEILHDWEIPPTRTIHIRLEPDVKDMRPARVLMAYFARAGYPRTLLVTRRHAASGRPAAKP